MDILPEPLLFIILSGLDDSADVARCRVATKAFDSVIPLLQSINLKCTLKWYLNSSSRVANSSEIILPPFKSVFLNLISNLEVLKSVCIGIDKKLQDLSTNVVEEEEEEGDDLYLTDVDFVREWLPRVSETLRSLSISDFSPQSRRHGSNVLPLVSAYCINLLELEVKNAWLSVDNLNPMTKLTSLTLEFIRFDDKNLEQLNKCFPNLQILNLIRISGLRFPHIQLVNLKTFHLVVSNDVSSLTIVSPNLITLTLECLRTTALYVEAPMMSYFKLSLDYARAIQINMYECLKTFFLESPYIGSLLHKFPFLNYVENVTLSSQNSARRDFGNSKFTLGEVCDCFKKMTSLCIKSSAMSELEPSYRAIQTADARREVKTFCAYLSLVDPLLSFSFVANVMNLCMYLSEVTLFIHNDIVDDVSKRFISRCMARWPGLKWRWGIWREGKEDSWMNVG